MIDKKNIGIFCLIFFCSFFKMIHSSTHWSDPLTISSSVFSASDPQVVIDSQGNVTAAWVENNTIISSSLPYGGSWGSPVTLSNVINKSSNPQLAVDSVGNITALWIENGVIESAILTFGGSWGAGTPISFSGASNPCLAIGSQGNAVAVWTRGGVIETATRTAEVWDSPLILSSANSDFPQVAISDNGVVIAVWQTIVSGADALMTAKKTLGGSWSSAISVLSKVSTLHHNYPKIAIDANGNAVLAWFRYSLFNGVYQNVAVTTSSLPFNASNWATPTVLSNPGKRNPEDLTLKLVCDTSGNAIAFWINSYNGQNFYIESSTASFGKSWGRSVFPYSPSLYSFAADIAVNSLGGVLATYMNWDGSLINIQSQTSGIASTFPSAWTQAVQVSQGPNNGYPRCAWTFIDNRSYAIVVWINDNGSNPVIEASTGIQNEIFPPTNLTVVQNVNNFGIYQDFFNTISWQVSPTPNILQYNIFRNGVFFASTDASILQIVDHNVEVNGPVTYGVAAMDSNYSQSTIAIIEFP